ncbi:MAG: calcium/sodium antiporter [archaeon]
MVMEYILFIIGIYLLVNCADFIVDSSSSLARKLGVSTLIIGMTIVAFGTTLPELIVNLFSIINGSSEVAFGNITGSFIANILLILGITAIFGVVRIRVSTVWHLIPFALMSVFLLFLLVNKSLFGIGVDFLYRIDGLILLSFLVIYLYFIFQSIKHEKGDESILLKIRDLSNLKIYLKLFLGFIGIIVGGRLVVNGAIFVASQLGVSEFLISATIIAVGTSLPELSVCIRALMKNKIDLAVGDIIGSNIFNILWVLGIVPVIKPLRIPTFINFDIAVMFFAALIIFIFMFTGPRHELRRRDGFILVILYLLYIIYIIIRG